MRVADGFFMENKYLLTMNGRPYFASLNHDSLYLRYILIDEVMTIGPADIAVLSYDLTSVLLRNHYYRKLADTFYKVRVFENAWPSVCKKYLVTYSHDIFLVLIFSTLSVFGRYRIPCGSLYPLPPVRCIIYNDKSDLNVIYCEANTFLIHSPERFVQSNLELANMIMEMNAEEFKEFDLDKNNRLLIDHSRIFRRFFVPYYMIYALNTKDHLLKAIQLFEVNNVHLRSTFSPILFAIYSDKLYYLKYFLDVRPELGDRYSLSRSEFLILLDFDYSVSSKLLTESFQKMTHLEGSDKPIKVKHTLSYPVRIVHSNTSSFNYRVYGDIAELIGDDATIKDFEKKMNTISDSKKAFDEPIRYHRNYIEPVELDLLIYRLNINADFRPLTYPHMRLLKHMRGTTSKEFVLSPFRYFIDREWHLIKWIAIAKAAYFCGLSVVFYVHVFHIHNKALYYTTLGMLAGESVWMIVGIIMDPVDYWYELANLIGMLAVCFLWATTIWMYNTDNDNGFSAVRTFQLLTMYFLLLRVFMSIRVIGIFTNVVSTILLMALSLIPTFLMAGMAICMVGAMLTKSSLPPYEYKIGLAIAYNFIYGSQPYFPLNTTLQFLMLTMAGLTVGYVLGTFIVSRMTDSYSEDEVTSSVSIYKHRAWVIYSLEIRWLFIMNLFNSNQLTNGPGWKRYKREHQDSFLFLGTNDTRDLTQLLVSTEDRLNGLKETLTDITYEHQSMISKVGYMLK